MQNTGYKTSGGVWVSNFLLRSVWVPGADGPWDKLGVMRSQYDSSNGYGIKATIGNVTMGEAGAAPSIAALRSICYEGSLTDVQKRKKAHRFTRATRRGLVIV